MSAFPASPHRSGYISCALTMPSSAGSLTRPSLGFLFTGGAGTRWQWHRGS